MKFRALPGALPEALPELFSNPPEPGTRRIVPLDVQKQRAYCTKCPDPNFATHKQIMVTVNGEGESVWRVIQYCCGQHAEELAVKWGIVVQQEVRS